MEENWLAPKQVAGELACTYKTVMKFISTGQLVAYKIGRHYKIKPTDLHIFISSSSTAKKKRNIDAVIAYYELQDIKLNL